jgi:F-type H+-transporting ATPase subunit epsilon
MTVQSMALKVWLPNEILFEEPVTRIRAEAQNGWFGLRPKHVDFVTALVPGVLTFQPAGKPEEYLALDRGVLVKCGQEVSVSTRQPCAEPTSKACDAKWNSSSSPVRSATKRRAH